ncbi:MAG: hypothetical protein WCE90_08770 [Candidatus Zixiibacteriota bacterium]
MLCWKCGGTVEIGERVNRKDTCPSCTSDLRCCFNCEFYDKEAYHQCKEPESEWVRYKERGNFCDFFRPKKAFFKKDDKPITKEDFKKKFDSLFSDQGDEA